MKNVKEDITEILFTMVAGVIVITASVNLYILSKVFKVQWAKNMLDDLYEEKEDIY